MRLFWSLLDLSHAFLVLLLWPLRLTTWGRARAKFEAWQDHTVFRADWAFEVSSEGEYEQVRPWMNELLREGRFIEVIYASESVDKGMLALQKAHPTQVRLLRLPLLTYRLGDVERFVTAPHLVMCRYDFFPALMRLASRPHIKSGLVWATFKQRRERMNNPCWRWWNKLFFAAFDWIIPATTMDESLFKEIHPKVLSTVDFRVGQIQLRVDQRHETFLRNFPKWDQFQKILHQYSRDRRMIIGSAWPSDLALLNSPEIRRQIMNSELFVMVVPHKLSGEWVSQLGAYDYPVNHVTQNTALPADNPGIWLLSLRGVLCELYAEVGKVYVGGGFERSIHSVMEPFVAGAEVWCGPKIHRSTEAELIQSVDPDHFHSFADHQKLADSLVIQINDAQGPDQRTHWKENQIRLAREYIQKLKD